MNENARFEEADVYAALGMDAPAEQPEVADPAGQAGGKEPEVTDPAGANGVEAAPQGNRQTDGGTVEPSHANAAQAEAGDGHEAGEMSREERARQAQARRERETQARVDAAVKAEREKHQAELKRVFERAGMTDRYKGNKPITTIEEFDAWDKAGQAAGLARRLQEGKLTPEDLQSAVDQSPAVREARELTEQLKARQQAEEAAARKAQFQQMVDKELEEIRKLDPSVASLTDILTREGGQEFMELVDKNGLSYVQAFKLSNGARLAKAQALAAAEGSARSRHGKDHMRTTVATGGQAADVPRETVEFYRQLDPEMTMDEIRKDYARWPKRKD